MKWTDGAENKTDISRELTVNNKVELPTPDYKGQLSELLKVVDVSHE